MSNRERGIGNVAFAMVLVLFVIAILMWFMSNDQVEKERKARIQADQEKAQAFQSTQRWKEAYEGLAGFVQCAEVMVAEGNTPLTRDEIVEKCRNWLFTALTDVQTQSTVEIQNESYRITPEGGIAVQVNQAGKMQVSFYGATLAKETTTVAAAIAPLAAQFRAAARITKEVVERQGSEFKSYEGRVSALTTQNSENQKRFTEDAAQKQANIDSLTTQVNSTQDSLRESTGKYDAAVAEFSQEKDKFDKSLRSAQISEQAAVNGLRNLREKQAIAIKEDEKDGEVREVSDTLGTVFINLGRKNRVSAGTVFKVWRPAKGNVREDVAVIRVIRVEETLSECRIVKSIRANTPVTKGMNVSNPFYDPSAKLNVHIWGSLKSYPTDVAKKRLAAAGVNIVEKFDDTVQIVVLGEPPVEIAAAEDEAGAAAAEKAARMDRERRLTEALQRAGAIGAVAVTEDVLRTFIDY